MAHVDRPLPSPADVLYYAGYACFILGAIELLRKRSDPLLEAPTRGSTPSSSSVPSVSACGRLGSSGYASIQWIRSRSEP